MTMNDIQKLSNKEHLRLREEVFSYPERINPSEASPLVLAEHLSRYNFAAKSVTGKKVLDVGCGAGYGTETLINMGADSVWGCDISADAISYAGSHYTREKLTFINCDCCSTSFESEFFDVAVAFEVIEHIEGPDLFLKEMMRILKKDAILICSVPNEKASWRGWDISPNKYHLHMFGLDEFKELLAPYFDTVIYYGQNKGKKVLDIDARKNSYQDIRSFLDRYHLGWLRSLYPKWARAPFQSAVFSLSGIFHRAREVEIALDDFPITSDKVEQSENLIAVCQNRKQ